MSYPFGWYFVRKLDSETYRSLLHSENAVESPVLGWNKPLERKDYGALRDLYRQIREGTRERYRGTLKGKEFRMLMNAFDDWERDFLPEPDRRVKT